MISQIIPHMIPNLISKEVSWLAFNHRVLMEARSPEVPLIERLRFMGIYSSNLDEFFRVRVATLRREVAAGSGRKRRGAGSPERVLKAVENQVALMQKQFELTWTSILTELAEAGISFIRLESLKDPDTDFVTAYFREKVRPRLIPLMLGKGPAPSIEDGPLHLLVQLRAADGNQWLSLIEVPTDSLPRFIELPARGDGKTRLILLEDIIRSGLPELFSLFACEHMEAYALKLTRDAELDVERDESRSMVEGVSEGLRLRRLGLPVHLVHDEGMPPGLLVEFLRVLRLPRDLMRVSGGAVHNRRDFMRFPSFGRNDLVYQPLDTLPCPPLEVGGGVLAAIGRGDILLSFPYQGFSHIIDMLREAAMDPAVSAISMCLYRVGRDSSVVNALVNAARNGKNVMVVVELQARFDEEANLQWGRWLEEEGVRVVYGLAGFKVHSKLLLITRKERGRSRDYAMVGTGNFNEDTARVYSDHSLLTADTRITRDVRRVFQFLEKKVNLSNFSHLLVSPFNTRKGILRLIRGEVAAARSGRSAEIFMKLNNMADEEIIKALYEASQAGVRVRLIVRSMFSIPDVWQTGPQFEAISLVDRFLEHARIFAFGSGDTTKVFLSSADMMERNLDRRVEVSCPIYDPRVARTLLDIMEIQWSDTLKTRLWTNTPEGRDRQATSGAPVRAQTAIHDHLRDSRRK